MLHTISNGDLTVTVDTLGAQLRSVKWKGDEYLWQGDPTYWDGQSPLLFPYVGRFTDGKCTILGDTYHMSIHGFAKDSDFELIEEKDDRFVFELTDSPDTLALYPYFFSLQAAYQLRDNTLSVTYTVKNRGSEMMYFGIGGHPGIHVPLGMDPDGPAFEDHYLIFSKAHIPSKVGQTPACFLSGQSVPCRLEGDRILRLDHRLFDDDAIVLKDVADSVTLTSDQSERSVTMTYTGLPYLGLWHMPHTDAPYVCIEPWSSLPSRQDIVEEFSCKSDLIRLPGGQEYRTGWEMSLR